MGGTAEVRWFFRGQAPSPAIGWFERLGAEPRERADHYLRLPETDALGVKLRGGQGWLELKLREHDHGRTQLSEGIAGNVEQWRKWSIERTTDGPSSEWMGFPLDRWITVHKTRQLVTYAPPNWKPSLEPAQGDGCNVEITDLEAEDQHWSTLGLEAFGSDDHVLESLWSTVRAFFGGPDLPQGLPAEASYGYPGWLQRLARHPNGQ